MCPGDQAKTPGSHWKPADKEANYSKVIFEIAKVDSAKGFQDTQESIANNVMKSLSFKLRDSVKV